MMGKEVKETIVMLSSLVIILSSCAKQNSTDVNKEVITGMQTNVELQDTVDSVEKYISDDYNYWTYHNINDTDVFFWDMASNKGIGCTNDNLTYYTQIVKLNEVGIEKGYPKEDYINNLVSEQYALFNLSGLEIGKWGKTADGEEIKYDTFRVEPYIVRDLNGREWCFMLYDYTMATTETEKEVVHYYNILGVSDYNDDWLTIELTGSIDSTMANLKETQDIMNEFAEIYGFIDVLPAGDAGLYLLGLDSFK